MASKSERFNNAVNGGRPQDVFKVWRIPRGITSRPRDCSDIRYNRKSRENSHFQKGTNGKKLQPQRS